MPLTDWCSLSTDAFSALNSSAWYLLPTCSDVGLPVAYRYEGPQPSALLSDRDATRFMRDFPIDSTASTAEKSENSIVFESGEFTFSKELFSRPSIGNLRWSFGISHQQNDVFDGILGRGWLYPQAEYIARGLGSYVDEVTADRPIAYWRLGDASQDNAVDKCGLRDGTYQHNPALEQSGIPAVGTGLAVRFAGSDQYIDLGTTPPQLDFQADKHSFTIETWVKASNPTEPYGAILTKGDWSTAQYYLGFASPTTITCSVGGQRIIHPLATASQDWHHLALVNRFTETESGNDRFEFTLFVNGVQVQPWKLAGAITSNAPVRIAASTGSDGSPSDFLHGILDEVAIYDHALDGARILNHYSIGISESPVNSRIIRKITPQHTTQVYIDRDGSDVFYGPDGFLSHDGGGTEPDYYELFANDGTRTRFHGFDPSLAAPGQLNSITTRYGHNQTYLWERPAPELQAQLKSVKDPLGRTVSYDYYEPDDEDGPNLLREITISVETRINFQYKANRLAAVLLPAISDAADGNEFDCGTAYAFRYDQQGRVQNVYFPKQTLPFLSCIGNARVLDIDGPSGVYNLASPRITVAYYADTEIEQRRDRVHTETVGDGTTAGGTWTFDYENADESQSTPFWAPGQRLRRTTTVTDPNQNTIKYSFSGERLLIKKEELRNRSKLSMSGGPTLSTGSLTTYFAHNSQKQPRLVIFPERNSVEYRYDSGKIDDTSPTVNFPSRVGLPTREIRMFNNRFSNSPTNPLPTTRSSSDFDTLTKVTEYEPLFNQPCVVHDLAGKPTQFIYDYQALTSSQIASEFSDKLGIAASQIESLISHVQDRLTSGISPGSSFDIQLANINQVSLSTTHRPLGAMVKIIRPSNRIEMIGVNDRGEAVTHTDPEGNITVTERYPENNYNGGISPPLGGLSTGQYGWVKAVYRDVPYTEVTSLAGLSSFSRIIDRSNSPDEYQWSATFYPLYHELGEPLEVETQDPDDRDNPVVRRKTRIDRTVYGEPYRITSPSPYEFLQEIRYDANRNVIRQDIEDRTVSTASNGTFDPIVSNSITATASLPMVAGSGGSERPGWFVSKFIYDFLDQRTAEHVEATGSTPDLLTTTYSYDRNGNLVMASRSVDATTSRYIEYDYDERNLRIAERIGGIATTVFGYDGNGNLRHVIGPANRDQSTGSTSSGPKTFATATITSAFAGSGSASHTGDWLTENIYDGYDRNIKTIDAVGNVSEFKYDGLANLKEKNHYGPASGMTPTTRTPSTNHLAATTYVYDEANRLITQTRVALEPDGHSLTNSFTYDLADRQLTVTGPNDRVTTRTYDGLGQLHKETDAAGNKTEFGYDFTGNLVKTIRTEVAGDNSTGTADEFRTSWYRYDVLGRLVIASHPGANGGLPVSYPSEDALHTLIGYDSRGNQTVLVDPNKHVVKQAYDGAGRLLSTTKVLDGTPIATTRKLDGTGLLIELSDSDTNTTLFTYDELGRLVKTTYPLDAESSNKHRRYYNASDLTSYIDGNLDTTTYKRDPIGRLIGLSAVGQNSSRPTVEQQWELDGLSRLTRATDSDVTRASIGDGSIAFEYDSLSRLIKESLDDWSTEHDDFDDQTPKKVTYPNGRALKWTFDKLNRPTRIENDDTDDKTTTKWKYFGSGQILEAVLGNGVRQLHAKNDLSAASPSPGTLAVWGKPEDERPGYDGAGRSISKRYIGGCHLLNIKITTSTALGSNRWSYAWVEQELSQYGKWIDKEDGLTSEATGILAYNMIETPNSASGVQGNSVDVSMLPDDSEMLPVSGSPVVQAKVVRKVDANPSADESQSNDVVELVFQYENAISPPSEC